jgi:hypothetical protein
MSFSSRRSVLTSKARRFKGKAIERCTPGFEFFAAFESAGVVSCA